MLYYSCVSAPDYYAISSDQLSLKDHNGLAEKFSNSENLSYTLKVSYNLFSPLRGHWNIEVHNGVLKNWYRDERYNHSEDKGVASLFQIKNLFRLGSKAYKEENYYKTMSFYDESGMIVEIRRFANPDEKNPIPADKTYSIRVLELNWLDGEMK